MRFLAITAAAAALAFVPPAVGRPGAPATVKLVRCGDTGVFQGSARSIAAADRMLLRMTLLERGSGGSFQAVDAPGLGDWRRSRPGATRFVYTHEVENLREGVAYRMAATFRWLGPDGDTVRLARRRSAICTPGGNRPDLRVWSIRVGLGPRPGTAAYFVTVGNTGSGPAGASGVSLLVDGTAVPSVDIGPLQPLERRTVEIAGPPCGRTVTAVADAPGLVPESNEDNNARTVVC